MGYALLFWPMNCFCVNPMLMMIVILIQQPLCSIALYKIINMNKTPF